MSPVVGKFAGTSAKVTPAATQVYALTATNTFGSVSAAVSVTVIAGSAPTIGSFTATPAKVSPGQASVLSWAETGATGLSVKPGVGAVTGASVKVAPSTTTSYTLTASNSFGSVTATASVMVGILPTITGFTATPAKVTLGQSTRLSWAVTGSPSLMLNPGFGPVAGTSVTLSPAATTTYVLTATNSFGMLLIDLDGNQTPTLRIVGPSSLVSSDGTAVVPFTVADADGPMPTVSCVPTSANCAIQGWNVVLTGMASGKHFFTIKAQDAGGKKVFAHFVVDVQ
jgi:hypothetical protein